MDGQRFSVEAFRAELAAQGDDPVLDVLRHR